MSRFEMKYFNTYYFCSIIEYVLGVGYLEYAVTLDEYTTLFYECEREDFPPESYLLDFIKFVVDRILSEQNDLMAEQVNLAIDEDGLDAVISQNHNVFYDEIFNDYIYTPFEMAIKHYHEKADEKMLNWIRDNKDDSSDVMDLPYNYFSYLEEKYEDVIDSISKDVFYILFQNREILLNFNKFMANIFDEKSKRVHLPQWVRNAVIYRDNGKCVMCGKNLTGLLESEKMREKQFDHIVPLEKGGLNDVTNIQLMCQKCHKEKKVNAYTSGNYSFNYDAE